MLPVYMYTKKKPKIREGAFCKCLRQDSNLESLPSEGNTLSITLRKQRH